MTQKPVKLTNSFEKDVHSKLNECVLKSSHQDEEEEAIRKIFKKFIQKNSKNSILLFAHQLNDKLSHLLMFKQECKKAGVELSISLYCKNKDPLNESIEEWYFREVDIALSDELEGMIIW